MEHTLEHVENIENLGNCNRKFQNGDWILLCLEEKELIPLKI